MRWHWRHSCSICQALVSSRCVFYGLVLSRLERMGMYCLTKAGSLPKVALTGYKVFAYFANYNKRILSNDFHSTISA